MRKAVPEKRTVSSKPRARARVRTLWRERAERIAAPGCNSNHGFALHRRVDAPSFYHADVQKRRTSSDAQLDLGLQRCEPLRRRGAAAPKLAGATLRAAVLFGALCAGNHPWRGRTGAASERASERRVLASPKGAWPGREGRTSMHTSADAAVERRPNRPLASVLRAAAAVSGLLARHPGPRALSFSRAASPNAPCAAACSHYARVARPCIGLRRPRRRHTSSLACPRVPQAWATRAPTSS